MKQTSNRRDFLRGIAATGALAAIGPRAVAGANDKLNIGVIGFAMTTQTVRVSAGQLTTQNFSLAESALPVDQVVAVGTRRILVSDGPSGVRGETWDERDPSLNLPSATALA